MNEIPSNVQTASSQDLERAQTNDVAAYLRQKFTGVNVSESADNPFQLDINYHGFTAAPLIGTPQGLSVYVDGVRVNELFGDTVNWDLTLRASSGLMRDHGDAAKGFLSQRMTARGP